MVNIYSRKWLLLLVEPPTTVQGFFWVHHIDCHNPDDGLTGGRYHLYCVDGETRAEAPKMWHIQ